MVAANEALFSGKEWPKTLLAARGFDRQTGARSGGIVAPRIVDLPAGTVLMRTYRVPKYAEGEWWFTPQEMVKVIEYFGRDGQAFAEGRQVGKGILQAVLAVRHDWDANNPDHLGQVIVIRTDEPLQALYGAGDVAPDTSQQSTLKPILISDGKGGQRGVAQVFLPSAWTYNSAFTVQERDKVSDSDLIRLATRYCGTALPFEFD